MLCSFFWFTPSLSEQDGTIARRALLGLGPASTFTCDDGKTEQVIPLARCSSIVFIIMINNRARTIHFSIFSLKLLYIILDFVRDIFTILEKQNTLLEINGFNNTKTSSTHQTPRCNSQKHQDHQEDILAKKMKRPACQSLHNGTQTGEENVRNHLDNCALEKEDCFSGQIKKQQRIMHTKLSGYHTEEEEEKEEKKNAFDVLPNELLFQILRHHLPPLWHVICKSVCQQWCLILLDSKTQLTCFLPLLLLMKAI